MDKILLTEKISSVFGLLIQCPLDVPLDTCPAIELRELSTEEKFKLVNEMSEEKLDKIIIHHKQCLRGREKKLFDLNNT